MNTPDLSFQKLDLADLEFLQYIGRATYEPYYRHIWLENGLDWYMAQCFGKEILQHELSDASMEYIVGRDEKQQIAGFMKIILLHAMPDKGESNALFLEKIYLMPEYFGKGIGQTFLKAAAQRAELLERKALWLNVMATGPISAYKKFGFQICGKTRFEYELLRPEERNGFVMYKKI